MSLIPREIILLRNEDVTANLWGRDICILVGSSRLLGGETCGIVIFFKDIRILGIGIFILEDDLFRIETLFY